MGLSADDIANLRALYASGATSVTIDGQTIQLDAERLERLLAQADQADQTARRNNDALNARVSMNMSGFIS